MSFNELDFFDESDNYGSGSGSPGKSVGVAGEVSFGDFFSTGVETLGNVVSLVVFVSIGVGSKVG